MANAFQFPDIFSAEYQMVFYKENVAAAIVDLSPQRQMAFGDVFHKSKRTQMQIQRYVRGTDVDIQDLVDTEDILTVDQQFAHGFYVDDMDKIQDNKDAAANYGRDVSVLMNNQFDADVLGQYGVAANIVDDGTLGGTAGQPISATTSNILSMFSRANLKLNRQNIPQSGRFSVISPDIHAVLIDYGVGRDTMRGDSIMDNGFFARMLGFDIYVSNQLTADAVLSLTATPSNGQTVTVDGITWTFVTSIGSTPGNVLIGADAASARVNLAAAINNPGVTNANQVALTGTNLKVVSTTFSAVNNIAAQTVTIAHRGQSIITVSTTLSGGNVFTLQRQHNLFGAKGAISAVKQMAPTQEYKPEPKKIGGNYLSSELYGVKTFTDGTVRLVDVQVNTLGL